MDRIPMANVDEVIQNMELMTELEPYEDESIQCIDVHHWTIRDINEYLKAMLDWEKAPVLPIRNWFNPPLVPASPAQLNDEELSAALKWLTDRLYEKKIVLDYTDHLSDRALYKLIVNRILPMSEKLIPFPRYCRHWDCSYEGTERDHQEIWLTYYASDEERDAWEEMHDGIIPPKRLPLYPRDLPTDDF